MPNAKTTLRVNRPEEEPSPESPGEHRPVHWRFWICAAAIPFVLLVVTSCVIRIAELDLAVASSFFSADSEYRFAGLQSSFCKFMYQYGPLPGIALGAASIWLWILAARRNPFSTSTRIAGFCTLLLLIGPGLIVNLGLKNNWGRPRPSQIEHFGGTYAYAPLGVRGDGPSNGSFPSGHAAIAFYLMAPGFLFMRRRGWLAACFLTFGMAAGIVMGAVRIVQGAHFFSDVIWSGAIVYFTGLILARVLHVDALDPSQFRELARIMRQDTFALLRLRRPAPPKPADAPDAESDRRAA